MNLMLNNIRFTNNFAIFLNHLLRQGDFFVITCTLALLLMLTFTSNLLLLLTYFELTLIPVTLAFLFQTIQSRTAKAVMMIFMFTFASGLFGVVTTQLILFIHNTLDMKELILSSSAFFNWEVSGLILGLLAKLPIWPLSSWLPEAHVEAPTFTSILLAGSLLKVSFYILIRLVSLVDLSIILKVILTLITLSFISIIQAGVHALVEINSKKVIAFSSISHMGFSFFGLLAVLISIAILTFIEQILILTFFSQELDKEDPIVTAYYGALYFAFSHAVIASALFIITGFIYILQLKNNNTKFSITTGRLIGTGLFFFAMVYFSLGNVSFPFTPGFNGEVYLFHALFIFYIIFLTLSVLVYMLFLSFCVGLIFFAMIKLLVEIIYSLTLQALNFLIHKSSILFDNLSWLHINILLTGLLFISNILVDTSSWTSLVLIIFIVSTSFLSNFSKYFETNNIDHSTKLNFKKLTRQTRFNSTKTPESGRTTFINSVIIPNKQIGISTLNSLPNIHQNIRGFFHGIVDLNGWVVGDHESTIEHTNESLRDIKCGGMHRESFTKFNITNIVCPDQNSIKPYYYHEGMERFIPYIPDFRIFTNEQNQIHSWSVTNFLCIDNLNPIYNWFFKRYRLDGSTNNYVAIDLNCLDSSEVTEVERELYIKWLSSLIADMYDKVRLTNVSLHSDYSEAPNYIFFFRSGFFNEINDKNSMYGLDNDAWELVTKIEVAVEIELLTRRGMDENIETVRFNI